MEKMFTLIIIVWIVVFGAFMFFGVLMSNKKQINKQINNANMICVNNGHEFIHSSNGWVCE